MTYANNTSVSVERTRAEIETLLARYGASAFGYEVNSERGVIKFAAHGRFIKFTLLLPSRQDYRYTAVQQIRRKDVDVERAWEQACRSAWRELFLVIKAKLVAVEAGIAVFEDEFLPYTVLPNGDTVAQWLGPQIEQAYATGLQPQGFLELGQ